MDSTTHETVLQPIDRTEAERLTTRIRLRLDAIADNYVAVMPLIREAIERQAWRVLGYAGVSEYVSECFGDALTQLGVEVRREVVRELTAAGMSTRAIGAVVGVSNKTVSLDQRAPVTEVTPEPVFVSATDALAESETVPTGPSEESSYPWPEEPFACGNSCWHDPVCPPASSQTSSPREDLPEGEFIEAVGAMESAEFDDAINAARADEDLSRTNVLAHAVEQGSGGAGTEPDRTNGLDGKSYPRQTKREKKLRRPPLPDSYFRAAHGLARSAESVTKLVDDDRYPANRKTVTVRDGSEMLRSLVKVAAAVAELDATYLAADERGRSWWLSQLDQATEALNTFRSAIDNKEI